MQHCVIELAIYYYVECVGSHMLNLKPEQRASMNTVDGKKNVLNLVLASLNHITACPVQIT